MGVSALVGAFRNMQKGLVDFRTAIVFAIPAFIAVYIARKFIVPAIPTELFSVGEFIVTKDVGIMVLFEVIMLVASLSMILDKKGMAADNAVVRYNYPIIILEGAGIGLPKGNVGASEGFLIIPTLVMLANYL